MEIIWLAFLTGLTSGGVSCIAVQGGLLTSAIANFENSNNSKLIVVIFLLSKLISYSLLGFILGYIGSVFVITAKISAVFQIFIGFFLLSTAGRILNIHPFFRYFVIQPPKFVYKLAKSQTKIGSFFAPSVLGTLTIFMPCGVTQAMMILALGTGNPVSSALIMFAFVLGTSPVFLALGISIAKLIRYKAFNYISAAIITILAIISFNSAMGLFGSPHTIQNYWAVISGKPYLREVTNANIKQGYQEVTIKVLNNGYVSDATTIKVGVPVRLKIITENIYSCSRAFTIPILNISKILPATGEEIIEFTPNKTGRLGYSCSMGMYTGSFNVVE